jgi:hypothetical protein
MVKLAIRSSLGRWPTIIIPALPQNIVAIILVTTLTILNLRGGYSSFLSTPGNYVWILERTDKSMFHRRLQFYLSSHSNHILT